LAVARYQNLIHRHCDLVTIANRSNIVNSFCSGFIQTDNHRLYATPAYHAQKLYATLSGDRPLRIESQVPPSAAADLSATLSADGDLVTLFAVNDGADAIARPLDLSAFGPKAQELPVWTLAATDLDATNSFGDPNHVAPVRSTLKADTPRFEYRFPPQSLTVLQWKVTK
jgi:alpha-N-arabinofuranosidase